MTEIQIHAQDLSNNMMAVSKNLNWPVLVADI